jgi:superfamily I DNA/RNA helicase/RecB family exonuclease
VLDPAQQAVVDHAGGPLLVLAGPGTGKTTTLVEAVAERVRRGLAPERVLVLTFSRKAADELRGRITARLGRTVTEPSAWTFHAFCHALVRRYTDSALAPLRLLSGAEREVRIRELLAGNAAGEGTSWPDAVRPALGTRGLAREVADVIDRARERGLDGPGLGRLGASSGRPGWVAAGRFLDEYLDVLDLRGELDYAGLVALATDLLGEPGVLDEVRDRYRAVFVDEYQDTDPSQEALLRLLAGDGRDLVVVGDPDQSIYAFRGADVAGILDFPDRFRTVSGGRAPTAALSVSRRFAETTLAPARALATRIPTGRLPAALREAHRGVRAVGPAGAPPEVRLYPTVAEEVQAVADLLRRAHLQDGVPWKAMAVLVRSGVRSIPVLRRAFAMAGVPVTVAADEVPVARDPAVAPLIAALRVADWLRSGEGVPPLDPEQAELLLLSPLGRALPSGLRLLGRRLRELARTAGADFPPPSAELVRDAILDGRDLSAVEDWAAGPARRLTGLLHAARDLLAGGGTPEEALWALWDGSGWGRRLEAESGGTSTAARQADRDLDAVLALFQAAARLEERRPRGGVTALLDELEAQEIPAAPTEERAASEAAVRLLTAHRAKGLEWDVVVVSGVQDGVWPDLRRRGSLLDADMVDAGEPRPAPTPAQLLAEERRLLYVALTRARRRLVVTAVEALDEGGERPSRFLDELDVEPVRLRAAAQGTLSAGSLVARLRRTLADPASSEPLRLAAARRLAALAAARGGDGAALVPVADPDAWWGLRPVTPGVGPLRDPALPLPLSGSALAAHQRCPLRWFLEREAGARGPSTAAQGFGIVLHAVVRLVSEGVLAPDVDALLARLDTVWPSLGFEAPWHGAAERREAESALRRFLVWHQARGREVAGSELEFRVTVGDVELIGSADRVEVAADGAVHVVDFKTGRTAKGRDEVERDPQLGVYQLAAREGAFGPAAPASAAPLPAAPAPAAPAPAAPLPAAPAPAAPLPAAPAPAAPTLGGADLVWLRVERKGGLPQIQTQEPLPSGEETWVHALLDLTAAGIRAEKYPARPDDDCDRCPFRGSCPAHPAGGQVVS